MTPEELEKIDLDVPRYMTRQMLEIVERNIGLEQAGLDLWLMKERHEICVPDIKVKCYELDREC